MKPRHWADIGENTFVLGVWFLYGVYRLLGRTPFRVFLYPVVLYYWVTHSIARQASLQYLSRLQAAQPVFGQTPGFRHSLRHFAAFAETLLDKMLAIGGHYTPGRLDFPERELLLSAQREGRGGVIVTAHMGCLELLQTAASSREGLKLTVLVHTAHAERFNRVLTRVNPETRVRLMQVAAFSPAMAMLLSDRVAAGEFVAIAGDRVPLQGDRTVQGEFLGHPAPWPVGPWLIASLLGCDVYFLACVHQGEGYRVALRHHADRIALPRATRNAVMATHAAAFAAWIETRLRESPYDWFNFFPFWDQAPHVSNAS